MCCASSRFLRRSCCCCHWRGGRCLGARGGGRAGALVERACWLGRVRRSDLWGGEGLKAGPLGAAGLISPPNRPLNHLQLGVILAHLLGKDLPFPLALRLQNLLHLLHLRHHLLIFL